MAKTIIVKHRCNKCKNPFTGKICPCLVKQYWHCEENDFVPPYPDFVSRGLCIIPDGNASRQPFAEWKSKETTFEGWV
jgi:hypothetical protein